MTVDVRHFAQLTAIVTFAYMLSRGIAMGLASARAVIVAGPVGPGRRVTP